MRPSHSEGAIVSRHLETKMARDKRRLPKTTRALSAHMFKYATVVWSWREGLRPAGNLKKSSETRRLPKTTRALSAHTFEYATVVWSWREGLRPAGNQKKSSDTRRLPWIFVAEGDAHISRPSYNGITRASQARDAGSTPVGRFKPGPPNGGPIYLKDRRESNRESDPESAKH